MSAHLLAMLSYYETIEKNISWSICYLHDPGSGLHAWTQGKNTGIDDCLP